MKSSDSVGTLRDTGERVVPDFVDKADTVACALLEQHLERYRRVASKVTGKQVLDLACGAGFGAALMAKHGARNVIGVDISKDAVDYARRRYARANLQFWCGGPSRAANMRFDLITCFETLEHVDDPSGMLRDLVALLEPEGEIYISATVVETMVLYRYHLHDLNQEQFRSLVWDCGLTIIEENSQSFHASPWAVWKSIGTHSAPPRITALLRTGWRGARRLLQVLLFEGLAYENLMLRCCISTARHGGTDERN